MLVTLSGIVTLVRLLQPKKALFSMLVTGFPPWVEGITNAPETVFFAKCDGNGVSYDFIPQRITNHLRTQGVP
jgi:hypothetical protein